MRRLILMTLLTMAPAAAQDQKFAPVQIDQATYKRIMDYLGDVPAKYANPLINELTRMEENAQAMARAEAQSKKEEPK